MRAITVIDALASIDLNIICFISRCTQIIWNINRRRKKLITDTDTDTDVIELSCI